MKERGVAGGKEHGKEKQSGAPAAGGAGEEEEEDEEKDVVRALADKTLSVEFVRDGSIHRVHFLQE